MIACSQLAATGFNLCSESSQAETKSGVKRFSVTYSKATNNWSAKPIKEKKHRSVFKNLVSCIVKLWQMDNTCQNNITNSAQNDCFCRETL